MAVGLPEQKVIPLTMSSGGSTLTEEREGGGSVFCRRRSKCLWGEPEELDVIVLPWAKYPEKVIYSTSSL